MGRLGEVRSRVHDVAQHGRGGREAAGSAPVVLTARIMLDEAVRVLENKLEYSDVFTLGHVYTPQTISDLQFDSVLSPASFSPVFSLKN